MRLRTAVCTAVLALPLLAGCGASDSATDKVAAERRTIDGSLLVVEFDGVLDPLILANRDDKIAILTQRRDILQKIGDGETFPCPDGPGGGFSDLRAGAQVLIEDGAGDVLASTALASGVLSVAGCTFTYSAEVPRAEFYKISIGTRDPIVVSYEQMQKDGWKVEKSIG